MYLYQQAYATWLWSMHSDPPHWLQGTWQLRLVTRGTGMAGWGEQARQADKRGTSHITRKPVFGMCNQGRFKLVCAVTETRWRLEISDIETKGIILSRQRTAKVLIRLRLCAAWSMPLLFAYGINRFSHGSYDTTVNPLYNVCVGPQWFMTLKWICRCNDFKLFRSQDE